MYFNKQKRIALRILVFMTAVSIISGGLTFTISPDPGTSINIIKTKANNCKVCKSNTHLRQCYNSLTLVTRTDVEFDCTKPQDIFRVEIVRKIACTLRSCDRIIQSDVRFSNLLSFHRTFIWKIEADARKSFQINFAKTGFTQIAPSDSCANKHTYTLRAADVLLGKFCLSGTISSAKILRQGSFSLDLPAGQKLSSGQFDVSLVERIITLANISVTLKEGSFSSTLLTPNYPSSFPNADLMEWYFQVPNNYNTTIKFLNLKQPTCLKDKAEVTYKGRSSHIVGIGDDQPVQKQGSFSLRLRNCHMDTKGPDGLSMNLTVTAFPAGNRSNERGVSHLYTIVGVLTALVFIFIVVLLVVCIVIRRKKNRDRPTEVSVYNPGNINLQTTENNREGSEDDYHVYTQIDESLVYSHLLQNHRDGDRDVYESYEILPGLEKKPTSDKGGDNSTVSLFQSDRGHMIPNDYVEFIVGKNTDDSEQKKKEEHPPTPQPEGLKGDD